MRPNDAREDGSSIVRASSGNKPFQPKYQRVTSSKLGAADNQVCSTACHFGKKFCARGDAVQSVQKIPQCHMRSLIAPAPAAWPCDERG